jgi:hypothetical protein
MARVSDSEVTDDPDTEIVFGEHSKGRHKSLLPFLSLFIYAIRAVADAKIEGGQAT